MKHSTDGSKIRILTAESMKQFFIAVKDKDFDLNSDQILFILGYLFQPITNQAFRSDFNAEFVSCLKNFFGSKRILTSFVFFLALSVENLQGFFIVAGSSPPPPQARKKKFYRKT